MAYLIAWGLYLVMAVLLMLGYERYITRFLADSRQLRIFLRALLAILLFTPGFVVHGELVYMVPAAVGVMFNILAHKPLAVLQASLPLLVVSVVTYSLLFFREIRRSEAPQGGT